MAGLSSSPCHACGLLPMTMQAEDALVIGRGRQGSVDYEVGYLCSQRLSGVLVVAEVLPGEDTAGGGLVSRRREAAEASRDAGCRVAQREREAVGAEEIH